MDPLNRVARQIQERDRRVRELQGVIERRRAGMGRRLLAALIRRRKELLIPVAEIARRTGLPPSNISRLETRLDAQNPSLETLVKYAAAVGLTLTLTAVSGDWRIPMTDGVTERPPLTSRRR